MSNSLFALLVVIIGGLFAAFGILLKYSLSTRGLASSRPRGSARIRGLKLLGGCGLLSIGGLLLMAYFTVAQISEILFGASTLLVFVCGFGALAGLIMLITGRGPSDESPSSQDLGADLGQHRDSKA